MPRRKAQTNNIMDFVILAYATTSRPLTIRGLTLRSSEDFFLIDVVPKLDLSQIHAPKG